MCNGKCYVKKKSNGQFDVTQGSHDSCECCELCGLYMLSQISTIAPSANTILYRDDGLMALKATGRQLDKIRKKLHEKFGEFGLKIIAVIPKTNMVEYLDLKLNLNDRTFRPYKKPLDNPVYIHSQSNHPPAVTKTIPKNINDRISMRSCNEKVFNEEKEVYQDALKKSGYSFEMKYDSTAREKDPSEKKKNRSKPVCWFNPPWSSSVKTPVGKLFLNIVTDCFPKENPLYKHFNRNTLKMSYSTCKNLKAHVSSHNRNILHPSIPENSGCNCRNKTECPLQGKCLSSEIVYQADVIEELSSAVKTYFGQTQRQFKQRFYEHTMSIKNESSPHATALSKHVWKLKNANKKYRIEWSIKSRAPIYRSGSRKCSLCIQEKLAIALCNRSTLLSNRAEILQKVNHREQ